MAKLYDLGMHCGGEGLGGDASAGLEGSGDGEGVRAVTGPMHESVEGEGVAVAASANGGAYRVGP